MPDDCINELKADEHRECWLLTQVDEIVKVINIEIYSNLEKLLRASITIRRSVEC
jgi:hypothetical protein